MKLTLEVLRLGSTQKPNRGESDEAFLKRTTHISVSGKGIDKMENLKLCKRLTVLYLYDNQIPSINNLEACRNLTRLYLQNNSIEEISGLDCGLNRLELLHLGGNKISRVAGLEHLPSLRQLHLDKQKLDPGVSVELDASTMERLAPTLTDLTLSENTLASIAPLTSLTELERLDLGNTNVINVDEMSTLVLCCPKLTSFNIAGCPIGPRDYIMLRQKLILAGPALVSLNDKEITDNERVYVQNMAQARSRRQSLASTSSKLGEKSDQLDFQCKWDQKEGEVPLPHLPPYASQYRDMILHQLAVADSERTTTARAAEK
ncbi:hypothetical protein HK097_004773 [Rhizophlyctis rosea]|uniref:Leucine-rich repeat-containing protein 67 n=1 Tax=Rhizophlyctis rosea TaxID=64517 RepID=A0AAD5X721_9FUNG|nr:hypothetical protein HK097_004773 [Rhizophlyctis rosea]